MKKFYILLLIVLSFFGFALAQQDNPYLDQVPIHLRSVIPPYAEPMAIVSSDGYENFFLGIDFAEPHISWNMKNPLQYFCAFNINATHYTLNGIDWFSNNPPLPSPQGDPVTAYDSIGNLYYMNMTGNPIVGCYIVKSTDNGQTWSAPIFCISGNDKNWVACDQTGGPYANYVYCTMTAGSGYGSFSRSTDHGATFQTTFTPNTQSLPGMMVCVGPYKVGSTDIPGGCVYVVTNSGSAISPVYTFYRSTDGGVSWGYMSAQIFAGYLGTFVNNRPSIENMRTRPYPFIAADNSYGPYRGRLYLVYATNTPNVNGAKPDIFCRYSTDQGASWSAATKINDDPNSENNHQWHPSIWCDKFNGTLYVKWFDTRNCPTSDSAEVYASYSTNGGVSFVTNQKIGNAKFRINCTSCGGGGTPMYLGDYDAIVSNGSVALLNWCDFRNGYFGSYTAYFPDFAMTTNPNSVQLVNNDSTFVTVKVPSVKLYTDKVKFTVSLDSTPVQGTISLSFVGKDSLLSYPDSVKLRIKAIGSVTPRVYKVNIVGAGSNGTPVHRRTVDLLMNVSYLDVANNRTGVVPFYVNNVQYMNPVRLYFANGSNVTVYAPYYYGTGGTRYRFLNWSNNGDTLQQITINSNMSLFATYKVQYRLVINSVIPNTFGAGYSDSAVSTTFGVLSRYYQSGNSHYYFRGWTGSGPGSYTSPDSSGNDSAVTISLFNPIVETARWQVIVGVKNIGTEIPTEFKLYDNYPNPFNPETIIKFDIPNASFVNITIYDMLGREVATLVNEFIKPGRYETRFDASGLESGIYMCRIKTESYVATKRMVVLK